MITTQIIENCIEELRAITKVNLAVFGLDGAEIASTFEDGGIPEAFIAASKSNFDVSARTFCGSLDELETAEMPVSLLPHPANPHSIAHTTNRAANFLIMLSMSVQPFKLQ